MTYLEPKELRLVSNALSTEQKNDWKRSKSLIIKMLEPAALKYQSKSRLMRAKQEPSENIDKFTARIRGLADHAFTEAEETQRNKTLVEVLMTGLSDKELALLLHSKFDLNNTELVKVFEEARRLEAITSVSRWMFEDGEDTTGTGHLLLVGDDDPEVEEEKAGPSDASWQGGRKAKALPDKMVITGIGRSSWSQEAL